MDNTEQYLADLDAWTYMTELKALPIGFSDITEDYLSLFEDVKRFEEYFDMFYPRI